jgi:hypothetical protein
MAWRRTDGRTPLEIPPGPLPFRSWPVNARVTNVKNNNPLLIEPTTQQHRTHLDEVERVHDLK